MRFSLAGVFVYFDREITVFNGFRIRWSQLGTN